MAQFEESDEPEVLAVVPLPSTAGADTARSWRWTSFLAGDPLRPETARDLVREIEHTFPELKAQRDKLRAE
jgi:hypothetical protein